MQGVVFIVSLRGLRYIGGRSNPKLDCFGAKPLAMTVKQEFLCYYLFSVT